MQVSDLFRNERFHFGFQERMILWHKDWRPSLKLLGHTFYQQELRMGHSYMKTDTSSQWLFHGQTGILTCFYKCGPLQDIGWCLSCVVRHLNPSQFIKHVCTRYLGKVPNTILMCVSQYHWPLVPYKWSCWMQLI